MNLIQHIKYTIETMETDLQFLDTHTNRTEGTIVLKLNEIVRKVVKARLSELEDTIVSFAVESIRDAIRDEDILNVRDDTMPIPLDTFTDFTPWEKSIGQEISLSDDVSNCISESESVAVPITLQGTEYYVILNKDYRVVYDRTLMDDGGYEMGDDIVGVLDEKDNLWKPNRSTEDGTIQSYIFETDGHLHKVHVKPVELDGSIMNMPVWEQK